MRHRSGFQPKANMIPNLFLRQKIIQNSPAFSFSLTISTQKANFQDLTIYKIGMLINYNHSC